MTPLFDLIASIPEGVKIAARIVFSLGVSLIMGVLIWILIEE